MGCSARDALCLYDHRRAAVIEFRSGIDSKLLQAIDERLDGTLAHSGNAIHNVPTAAKRYRRREKSGRRAGISHEKCCLGCRNPAALAAYDVRLRVLVGIDRDPERAERTMHRMSVIGEQCPSNRRLALSKGGNKQSAIGQALRAR